MKVLEDSETPLNAPLAAKYRRSFAFFTLSERVPVIITKTIDFIARDKKNIIQNYGKDAEQEIKDVIGEISQLKNHLQTAKCFQEFTSDSVDADLWNSELRDRKTKADPLNYFESDWIFAECYLYRRLQEIFATKKSLCYLDPFKYQKDPVLERSITEIGPYFQRLIDENVFEKDHDLSSIDVRSNLSHMIKCSLWANRMDQRVGGENTDVTLDFIDLVKSWGENILVDDVDKVSSVILGTDPLDCIDLVTDNGATELLNDLILADFLVTRCNVKTVRFRVKPIFWFVSNVTDQDFHTTIDKLSNHPQEHYKYFGDRWRSFINQGVFKVSSEAFWCMGFNYSEIPRVDPVLFNQLKSSPLVIFKGDLNYRKLVQDRNWETTTPFHDVLGNLSSISILALRTCKTETIAGLKPGVAQKSSERSPDWLISGEYGLIQFNPGQ